MKGLLRQATLSWDSSHLITIDIFNWMLGIFSYFYCHQLTLKKKPVRNTIRVSEGLDLDQEQHSVGPDLGPNCKQRLSADDKSHHWQGKG